MDIEPENRFKALIQPIRDLSLNWDIDIAEELGDYLEELDNLQITLDSGHNNLNFAEAALLIQGSAAVYSKKVEYLHQLVLHALELITFQKNTKAANGVAGAAVGAAGALNQPGQKGSKAVNMSFLEDERILFGSDPEYLLLDDVLEEGTNIALYIPKNSTKDAKLIRRHSLSGDLSKSSMILMHTILHVDNGSTSLRLSTCRMDANGALLIGVDPATSAPPAPHHDEISMIAKNNTSMYTVDSRAVFDDEERGRLSAEPPIDGGNHSDSHHFDDDGNNDNYAPPPYDDGDMGGGYDDFEPEHGASSHPAGGTNLPPAMAQGASEKGPRTGAGARSSSRAKDQPPVHVRKTVPSPLDPHEASSGSKSCRKGHTYRIPSCLSHRRQQSNSSAKATAFDQFQRDPSTALLTGRVPLFGLINAEFQDLAKEIRRSVRSEQFQRRLAAQQNAFNDDDYLYKDPTEALDDVPAAAHDNNFLSDAHREPEKFWEDEDDDDGGMPMYWPTDDGDDIPMNADGDDLGEHVTAVLDKADIQALASFSKPKPLYSNPFAAVFEEEDELDLARRVEEALNDSLSLGNTYESLCRRHIQDFMKGAEVYARYKLYYSYSLCIQSCY